MPDDTIKLNEMKECKISEKGRDKKKEAAHYFEIDDSQIRSGCLH